VILRQPIRSEGSYLRHRDEYLLAVVEAYNYYFLHFEEAPLLILQGRDINAILDERFVEELLNLPGEPHSGIRFWNPMVRSGENG
jgi:hypothetical protein